MRRRPLVFLIAFAIAILSTLFLRPRPAETLNPNHQCAFCHSVHGAPGPTLLNNAVVETLCLTCHGPAGISALKAENHKGHTCTDCHTPHNNMTNWLGGTNLSLVGTNVDGTGVARVRGKEGIREVVFESHGTWVGEPSLHSFADGDEDGNGYYDGPCETCHPSDKWPKRSKNPHEGLSGFPGLPVEVGDTCTRCHTHAASFMPPEH